MLSGDDEDVLGSLPDQKPSQLPKLLSAIENGQEVIASELAHLARKASGAVGEEDLRLAHAAGIEKDLAGRRMACVIFKAQPHVQTAEWNPTGLTTPTRLDDLITERKQPPERLA